MEAVRASFMVEEMRPEKWTKVCSDEGDGVRKTVPGREKSKQTPVGMNCGRAGSIAGPELVPRVHRLCALPGS